LNSATLQRLCWSAAPGGCLAGAVHWRDPPHSWRTPGGLSPPYPFTSIAPIAENAGPGLHAEDPLDSPVLTRAEHQSYSTQRGAATSETSLLPVVRSVREAPKKDSVADSRACSACCPSLCPCVRNVCEMCELSEDFAAALLLSPCRH